VASTRPSRRRGRARNVRTPPTSVVTPGQYGGQYKPLTAPDLDRLHNAALTILSDIGMGNPIPILERRAIAAGCHINEHGRLCFPQSLVEDVIESTPKNLVYYGRNSQHDVEYKDARVHFGASGEAVRILDYQTGKYRPSTLRDVYDCGRIVDKLEHIHDYSRWIIPTDIDDQLEADINTAYASFAATEKSIALSFDRARNVEPVLEMAQLMAGGEKAFRERPFCNGGGCCVVSPLTYATENSEVCIASTRLNSPVWVVVAPQAGATAPAPLAGALAQAIAEALAGILLIQLVVPGYPVTLGAWPFVSDLRTGAFSGGGGEEGLLNAAAAQIANFYRLPCSVSAGMTDAKIPDNQAGFEKGINVTLAALAGANSVGECAGMIASLMGCSFESLVIDNDMIGCVQRVLRGIEVTDDTLSLDVIRNVVLSGPGHFLSEKQTLDVMETEYLYPTIADRSSIEDWEADGAKDIRANARDRVDYILSNHYPRYLDDKLDRLIRDRFPILLDTADMRG